MCCEAGCVLVSIEMAGGQALRQAGQKSCMPCTANALRAPCRIGQAISYLTGFTRTGLWAGSAQPRSRSWQEGRCQPRLMVFWGRSPCCVPTQQELLCSPVLQVLRCFGGLLLLLDLLSQPADSPAYRASQTADCSLGRGTGAVCTSYQADTSSSCSSGYRGPTTTGAVGKETTMLPATCCQPAESLLSLPGAGHS